MQKRAPHRLDVGEGLCNRKERRINAVRRSGSDRRSRVLRQSTIGAKGFNVRVRNGIGWDTFAITTGSSNRIKE